MAELFVTVVVLAWVGYLAVVQPIRWFRSRPHARVGRLPDPWCW